MDILNQNNAGLENDVINMTTRKNPDSTSGMYLVAVKVSQYRMVDGNIREKE